MHLCASYICVVDQVLILETEEHAIQRGAQIYCELAGVGSSNDAFHVTHPDPSGRGAILSMRRALADAGLAPSGVEYVNAHATSTPVGDDTELRAVAEVFGTPCSGDGGNNGSVAVSSTKGATGHLLAAAGAAEAAFCVLAVHHGRRPPTFNLDGDDSGAGAAQRGLPASVRIIGDVNGGEAWSATGRAALSNSFGFGGTNASLVFREYP